MESYEKIPSFFISPATYTGQYASKDMYNLKQNDRTD